VSFFTEKKLVPDMIYNVFGDTLNLAQLDFECCSCCAFQRWVCYLPHCGL